jgi:hypothetical protein
MGKPAELSLKDIAAMRALMSAVIDGVEGDTMDPYDTLVRFAEDNDISMDVLVLQMAQFAKLRDEECVDLVKILDDYSETHKC